MRNTDGLKHGRCSGEHRPSLGSLTLLVRVLGHGRLGLPRLFRPDAEGAHHLVVLVLDDVGVPDVVMP